MEKEVKNLGEATINGGEPKKKTPVQYDPRKKYTWDPADQFVFSGEEYMTILNAFRTILSSAEGQRILMIERAHFIAESALARGLELGFVKEKEEPKPEMSPGIPPLRKS